MKVRRLDAHGSLCFAGKPFAFCRVLAKEPVALELIDDDTWEVFYGSILLAELRIRGPRDVSIRRVA